MLRKKVQDEEVQVIGYEKAQLPTTCDKTSVLISTAAVLSRTFGRKLFSLWNVCQRGKLDQLKGIE